jgi:hypothetical protein
MSTRKKCLPGLFAILVLFGCSDLPTDTQTPLAPMLSVGTPAWGGEGVKVMSRNVYPGADVTPIILFQPDPNDTDAEKFAAFAAVVNGVWQQAKAADFGIRAERLAWEIATHRPHAVGLQEATTFVETLQGPGGPFVTELAFLDVLLEALADRGAAYSLAALNIDLDVTLPIDVLGSTVRYVDMDAVIVREDVDVLASASGNYPAAVTVTVPTFAGPLALLRGWNRLDLAANGQTVHFVNTHLEPDEISLAAQAGQATVLATMLAGEDDPVILVGDLNADPDQTASPNAYDVFQAAGYTDGWPMAAPPGHALGYTCCHDPDLQNLLPDLFERIDYVMLGPGFPVGQSQAWLVGDRPSSAHPGGVWPSDHAGVVLKLEVTPPALAAQ